MLKVPLLALFSVALVGCQTAQVRQLNYDGYLEQPSSPFQMTIKPTKELLYRKVEDGQASRIQESIKRSGDFLNKSMFSTNSKFDINFFVKISPIGQVKEYKINNINIKSNVSNQEKKALKKTAADFLEGSGIMEAASRHSDYALGQDIYEGFVSRCVLLEGVINNILFNIFTEDGEIPESSIKSESDSECKFIGITHIKNRKAAVFSENGSSSISITPSNHKVTLSYASWRAIDTEKGLVIGNAFDLYSDNNDTPSSSSSLKLLGIRE